MVIALSLGRVWGSENETVWVECCEGLTRWKRTNGSSMLENTWDWTDGFLE